MHDDHPLVRGRHRGAAVLIIATCLLVGFMTPIVAIVMGLSAAALVVFSTFDTSQQRSM